MSNQQNYDFIMNPQQPAKKPLLNVQSQTGRILVVGGGLVLLLILVIIVGSILGSSGKAGRAQLVLAGQQQTELIRISKIGTEKAVSAQAKNYATTASVSLESDKTKLTGILSKNGVKLDAKQLALGKDTKTDAALTQAEQSNRFDEVFTETLKKELQEYQATLKAAYDATSNKAVKTELEKQFNNAGILIKAR